MFAYCGVMPNQNCHRHRLDTCLSAELYMTCHCPLLVPTMYYIYRVKLHFSFTPSIFFIQCQFRIFMNLIKLVVFCHIYSYCSPATKLDYFVLEFKPVTVNVLDTEEKLYCEN